MGPPAICISCGPNCAVCSNGICESCNVPLFLNLDLSCHPTCGDYSYPDPSRICKLCENTITNSINCKDCQQVAVPGQYCAQCQDKLTSAPLYLSPDKLKCSPVCDTYQVAHIVGTIHVCV